jgi:hypothetical protein
MPLLSRHLNQAAVGERMSDVERAASDRQHPAVIKRAAELPSNTLKMAKMSKSRMTAPARLIAVGIMISPPQKAGSRSKTTIHSDQMRPRSSKMIKITTTNPSPPLGK